MKIKMNFKSRFPRELLNEIKWTADLSRCVICYISRGSPGDVELVNGGRILKIDRGFMTLTGSGAEDAYIPYHRIVRIKYDNDVVFERIKNKDRK